MSDLLTKSITQKAVDVNREKRIVEMYYASFDEEFDSDGDIIDKSAFNNTLSMNGPNSGNRIWHLINHMVTMPINKPTILEPDSKGLRSIVKFPNTTLGNDYLELYYEKAITEHSFGYNVINSRPIKNNSGQDGTLLTEIRLWEGSSVLWGANQNTPTVGIKAEEFKMQIDLLDKIMHNGTLSDETFKKIEQLLNDLKLIFNANKPVEAGKTDNDEGEIKKEAINIITNFKFNLYGKP